MQQPGNTAKLLTRDEISKIAENFTGNVLIGETHFGELFRGRYLSEEVTVKVWGFPFSRQEKGTFSRNKSRFENEVKFLTDPSNSGQPCIPKLVGYYPGGDETDNEYKLFVVVYDFAPGSLLSSVTTDVVQFRWKERIEVLRTLARLLYFLHDQEPPYKVCNLDPTNIMLDKSQNPKLIDFSLITRTETISDDNMQDIHWIMNGFIAWAPRRGWCFVENDAYSFALILLGLISNHVHKLEPTPFLAMFSMKTIREWALQQYENSKGDYSPNSLAHKIFMKDEGFDGDFAAKITNMAMKYLCYHSFKHLHRLPSMKFFERLLSGQLLDYVDGIASDILLDVPEHEKLGRIEVSEIEAIIREENMIGPTQFGALYKGAGKFHGYIVKTWAYGEKDDERIGRFCWYRFKNEIKFLTRSCWGSCPQIPKIKAYFCNEGNSSKFAVVYDLSSTDHDTLQNLIIKGDFTWANRIEVALNLAHMVEALHSQLSCIICDLDWCTIMLQKMRNPVLVDFSLVTPATRLCECWLPYPFHYQINHNGLHSSNAVFGKFGMAEDVFAFGSILLGLISKHLGDKRKDNMTMSEWAQKEYKIRFGDSSCELRSLADNSFGSESEFNACSASIITKMALNCLRLGVGYGHQPSMKEVVKVLEACHSILEVRLNQRPYVEASDVPLVSSQCCLKTFSEEDLKTLTGEFSQENLIEANESRRLYTGKAPHDKYVTVKIWCGDSSSLDIFFLSLPEVRKNYYFGELIGYHKNNWLGVVYNFHTKGPLSSLINEAEFTWAQRISVALTIAEWLAFLDGWKSLPLICKIDAKQILLDQNFNPMLSELHMLTNGTSCEDNSCEKSHVKSFGDILSSLITKIVGQNSVSRLYVHPSLKAESVYDVQLGERMEQLAFNCLHSDRPPTMTEIIEMFPGDIKQMVRAKRRKTSFSSLDLLL